MSHSMMFWALTTPKNEVLGVCVDDRAVVVSINGVPIEGDPRIARAISMSGIHHKDVIPAMQVVGLFREEEAAKSASSISRHVEAWDDWFHDQTRQVLQLIGWGNPAIELAWLAGGGQLSPLEQRFRDRLPDLPMRG